MPILGYWLLFYALLPDAAAPKLFLSYSYVCNGNATTKITPNLVIPRNQKQPNLVDLFWPWVEIMSIKVEIELKTFLVYITFRNVIESNFKIIDQNLMVFK